MTLGFSFYQESLRLLGFTWATPLSIKNIWRGETLQIHLKPRLTNDGDLEACLTLLQL